MPPSLLHPISGLNRRGLTLVELMVTVAIIGVGLLGAVGAYQLVSTSVQYSRTQTLANTLAEQQMEELKDYSYFQLLVTTSTTVDTRFSPNLIYDNSNYPPQNLSMAGTPFLVTTRVDFAYRYNNTVSTTIWTTEDTGLKLITINVSWQQHGQWRQQTLQNVMSNPIFNPLNASFKGTVHKLPAGTLTNAEVQVIENGSWFTYSQAGGAYSFSVSPGTYTLIASYPGYYSSTTSGYLNITNNQTIVQDFTLSPIATGSVSGYIYDFDSLVISQVVSSTDTAGQGEYIELYNPTSQPVNIVNNVDLVHWDGSNSSTTIALTYTSTYVPVNCYYLIANEPTLMVGGAPVAANAVYSNPLYQAPAHLLSTTLAEGIELATHFSPSHIDGVAWKVGASPAPPGATEGVAITPASGSGLAPDEQFVRMTDPGRVLTGYGNAYDSGNNNLNFVDNLSTTQRPRNVSSGPSVPIAGVPAVNALINMTDPLSSTTHSINATAPGGYPVASFNIPNIETGTWSMNAYLSAFGRPNFLQTQNITILPLVSTSVPNGSTNPTWIVPGSTNTLLSSTSNYALITGTIYDPYGNPLPAIKVFYNGRSTMSGADGSYFLAVPPGNTALYANTGYYNPAYTLGVVYLITAAGNVYNQDVTIYFGGTLQGFFQTPLGTPLPNRSVVAVFGVGNQYSQAVSDQTGYFYLRNITTGTYTITPTLDNAEIASPLSITGVLNSTGTATYVSTFTITNALGKVSGQVLKGSDPITTGVLVIATTSTITGLPAAISGASGPLCNPCYYGDISDGNGGYSLSVRSSPNPYHVYGWYTTPSSTSFTTAMQNFSVTVSTGQILTQNFVW